MLHTHIHVLLASTQYMYSVFRVHGENKTHLEENMIFQNIEQWCLLWLK